MGSHNLQEILRDLEAPVEEKTINVTIDKNLENNIKKIFEIYKLQLEYEPDIIFAHDSTFEASLRDLSRVQITPNILTEFLLCLSVRYEPYNIKFFQNTDLRTGLFISALVQRAYDLNYNNFKLILLEPLDRLRYMLGCLKGKSHRRLKVSVTCSYFGNYFGGDAEYVDFNLRGSVGESCLAASESCSLHLFGNVSGGLGSNARNLNAYVSGRVSDLPMVHAATSVLKARQLPGDNDFAITIKQFLYAGSKIYKIKDDGSEELLISK